VDLPELVQIEVPVLPSPREAADLSKKGYALAEHTGELALVEKLKQLASGFYYGASGAPVWLSGHKVHAAGEWCSKLGKCLLVYEHQAMEEALRLEVTRSGLTYAEFRTANMGDLVKRDVVALHPASAGHGIDGLQGYFEYLVFVQPDWSGGKVEQTIKRIHRSGATKRIVVYFLISPGTIEDAVYWRAEGKRGRLTL
jgi:hypothetical protein